MSIQVANGRSPITMAGYGASALTRPASVSNAIITITETGDAGDNIDESGAQPLNYVESFTEVQSAMGRSPITVEGFGISNISLLEAA